MTHNDNIQVTQDDNHEVQKPCQHVRKTRRQADAEGSVQGLTWVRQFLTYIYCTCSIIQFVVQSYF